MAIDVAPWLAAVPEGWRPLLEQLGRDLKAARPTATILDAKEKFGTLRVYLKGGDQRTSELVDHAEQRSQGMCEQCGEPARLMVQDHFYATLCPRHAAGYEPADAPPIVSLRVRFPEKDG